MRNSNALSKLLILVSLGALGACADGPTQPTDMAAPSAVSLSKITKICNKEGYLSLVTEAGAPFATQKECAKYGDAGGTYGAAPTLVATLDGGGVRVTGTGLQPGTDLTGYLTGPSGLFTFSTPVGPDGNAFITFSTSPCPVTNGYGVATTLAGGAIESNHIDTVC